MTETNTPATEASQPDPETKRKPRGMEELGKIAYDEWAAAQRRFMKGTPKLWIALSPAEQGSFIAASQGVANAIIGDCPWCGDQGTRCPDCGTILTTLHHAPGCKVPCQACQVVKTGGQWLRIAFKGYVELTGYVTEVTIGGQPAFHIDLPDRLWGGNPLAWEEYAASGLHSRRPVTEESVRAAWEAEREQAAQRAREEAEWRRGQERRAISPAPLSADSGEADAYWDEDGPF